MDVEDGNNEGEGPGKHPVVLGCVAVADRSFGNDEEGKNEGGEQFEHLGSCIDWIPEFGHGYKEMALQYSIGGRGSKKKQEGIHAAIVDPLEVTSILGERK
jgi:hypothetical protein